MEFDLIVVHPFANYVKGQRITDPDEVEKLKDDREHHFVRVPKLEAPAQPAPLSPPPVPSDVAK